MIKINLLKSNWVGIRKIERVKRIIDLIMILIAVAFLVQVFYVTGRLVYLRTRITNTQKGIDGVKQLLSKRNDELVDYVWTKRVLGKIILEKGKEYKYKEYLLEINDWVTSGSSLLNVSFTKENEIAFSIQSEDVDAYTRLENYLATLELDDKSLFSFLKQESMTRPADGSYMIRMTAKIKK